MLAWQYPNALACCGVAALPQQLAFDRLVVIATARVNFDLCWPAFWVPCCLLQLLNKQHLAAALDVAEMRDGLVMFESAEDADRFASKLEEEGHSQVSHHHLLRTRPSPGNRRALGVHILDRPPNQQSGLQQAVSGAFCAAMMFPLCVLPHRR